MSRATPPESVSHVIELIERALAGADRAGLDLVAVHLEQALAIARAQQANRLRRHP